MGGMAIMALMVPTVPPAGILLRMEIPEIRQAMEVVEEVVEVVAEGAATMVVIVKYESTVRCYLCIRNAH